MFLKKKSEFIFVLSAFPSEESAAHVATEVVHKKLASCAHIMGKGRSLYWWDGLVQDNPEVMLSFKTVRAKWDDLQKEIKLLHPYENPAIIAIPIDLGSGEYLEWIRRETTI